MKNKHPKEVLVEIMNRVYNKGYTTTSGGNFSIMAENGDIYITPSGYDKGSLTVDDIVVVKPNGETIGKHKPSMEIPFHSRVYKTRPDMKAILHAHPPALVAVSLLNVIPNINLTPIFSSKINSVDIADYDVPGSIRLGEKIDKVYKKGSDAVMMNNHGVVVVGKDLYDAFDKFESLETCAMLLLESQVFGGEKYLRGEQIAKFNSIATTLKEGTVKNEVDDILLKNDLARFSKRSYHHKYFTSSFGIFAVRSGKNSFLIMGDNCDRDSVCVNTIAKVENDTFDSHAKPSRFASIVKSIFDNNADVNAVSIASPVNAMAFGVTGQALDSKTIPESYLMMRELKQIAFDEFVKNPIMVGKLLNLKSPVVMVDNAIVIAVGATLTKCFDSLEITDVTAKTLLYGARLKKLGGIHPISEEKVDELKREFNL